MTPDQTRARILEAADGLFGTLGFDATTTRDIADTFRQRVQLVLDAKAPSPTGYWTVRWDPAGNEVTVLPSQPNTRRA